MSESHGSGGALMDGMACVRACGYVTVRQRLRRLRGIAGKPWGLLGLVLGVGLVAAVQLVTLRQAPVSQGLGRGLVERLTEIVPLMLPLLMFTATFRSPLRLNVADVSWLLTAPGGRRAVFGWQVILRPAQYALIGGVATVVSRWQLSLPLGSAWKVAVVAATVGLVLRITSYGAHLVAVRAHARVPLRILAAVWALVLVSASVTDFPGEAWVQLLPMTQRLLAAGVDPGSVASSWLLAMLAAAVAVAALLIAIASGFQEAAEDTARQGEQAQETMRRSRSGQEMGAKAFRTGLPSLRARPAFAGERALCYRALAQERRILRQQVAQVVVGLAITGVLLVLWPRFAWAPAVYLLLGSVVSSSMAGLAIELDHYHLWLAPLRPIPTLLWVNAVPAVRTLVTLEVLWLPLMLADAIDSMVVITGVVLLPCVIVLSTAAGGLSATVAESVLARFTLPVALVAAGAAPAFALVVPVFTAQKTPLLVLLAAALLLAASIPLFVLIQRRVWNFSDRIRE